jgi:hypothetical protein
MQIDNLQINRLSTLYYIKSDSRENFDCKMMFAKARLNKQNTFFIFDVITPNPIIVEHKIFQVGPVALSPKAFVSMKI